MAKPMGRSDDMMIIRGVNVFPSQIESVLITEGFTSNYEIRLGRVNNSDTFDVYVELPPEQFDDSVKTITSKEKSLAAALRTMLGIGPTVHLVPPKTIQRSEGKAKRVIDERNLHD
jgi:phenylacetate-CoA ligase